MQTSLMPGYFVFLLFLLLRKKTVVPYNNLSTARRMNGHEDRVREGDKKQ